MSDVRKKVLWVGDAGCPTGFANATHGILDTLKEHFDVTVLGINYRGDPDVKHKYPYDIWAANATGDWLGVNRILWMCDLIQPDVVVLQNDGWNMPSYVKRIRAAAEYTEMPIVAAVAVDGKNFQGSWLTGIHTAVFWTMFAHDEARIGGYTGPADIIPLGVDLDVYRPIDRYEARQKCELPKELDDAFIVGNVNRNQPRKRWDLTIKYFADWLYGDVPVGERIVGHNTRYNDAYLVLHAAPTGETSMDVNALAAYYGVTERVLTMKPEPWYGYSQEQMNMVYNCFDLCISTTQGEGMGLPAMEAMACGVPCLLPDWSAYGDWAKDAASLIPCSTTAVGLPYVGVIGGVVDEEPFVRELERFYQDRAYRAEVGKRGQLRVNEDRFRWPNIAMRWKYVLENAIQETDAPAWREMIRNEVAAARG